MPHLGCSLSNTIWTLDLSSIIQLGFFKCKDNVNHCFDTRLTRLRIYKSDSKKNSRSNKKKVDFSQDKFRPTIIKFKKTWWCQLSIPNRECPGTKATITSISVPFDSSPLSILVRTCYVSILFPPFPDLACIFDSSRREWLHWTMPLAMPLFF